MLKKSISYFLILVMLLTVIPVSVFAENGEEAVLTEEIIQVEEPSVEMEESEMANSDAFIEEEEDIVSLQSTVSASISASGGQAGDTMTTLVLLNPNSNACYIGFDLVYDTTMLSVVSAKATNFFSGAQVSINTAGKVSFYYNTTTPITAGNIMLSVTFTLKKAGTTALSLQNFVATDSKGQKFTTSCNPANITIADKTYTVTYDANGGSGAPGQQSKSAGTALTLSETKPTLKYCTFLGWGTSATDKSATYQPGGTYSADRDITLYAVWDYETSLKTPLPYKTTKTISVPGAYTYFNFRPTVSGKYTFGVTDSSYTLCGELYDNSGNVLTTSSNLSTTKMTYELTANTLYHFGVKFKSVNTIGSFTVELSKIVTECSVRYYVLDEENSYEEIHREVVPVNTMVDLSYKAAKDGWVFVGWNTDKNATTALSSHRATQETEKLYAIFKRPPVTFTVGGVGSGEVGDEIDILVSMSPNANATYIDYNLNFDSTYLECVSSSKTALSNEAAVSRNTSYVKFIWNSATPITNGGNILKLTFKLKKAGTVKLNMSSVVLKDADGKSIDSTYIGGEIKISTSSIVKYNITYNGNGGSNVPSAQVKESGKILNLSSQKPTRFGYTFLGWSTSSSATTAMYLPGGEYTAEGNKTLYAVWAKATDITSGSSYSCNITLAGTLVYYKFTPQTAGTYVFESAVPSGSTYGYLYNASGTQLKANGNNPNFKITYALEANKTYYYAVKFYDDNTVGSINVKLTKEVVSYTVTYNYAYNGGTSATKTSASVVAGANADLTVNATKAGWEFIGWHTNANATSALSSYTVNNAVTLYAIYKKVVTASFYSGAKVLQTTKSATLYNRTTNGTVTIPTPTSYSGWSVIGWRDDETAGNSELASGSSVSLHDNKTYYAVYSRGITLKYNANGRGTAPSSVNITQYYNACGIKSVHQIAAPYMQAPTGYIFEGWAKNSTSGQVYQTSQLIPVDDNTTMYALWKSESQFTVTYKARVGGVSYEKTLTHPKNTKLTLPACPFANLASSFTHYIVNGTDVKYPGDQITISADTNIKLWFVPQLITQFANDTKKVFANFAGANSNIQVSNRGFKYKKIGTTNETNVPVSTSGDFVMDVSGFDAGCEYECYAYVTLSTASTVKGSTVRFKIPAQKLHLSETDIRLTINDNYVLVASVKNYNANQIIWQSSNPSVATVKDGFVSAKAVGSTIITARTFDGKFRADCNVTVKRAATINASSYDFSEWNMAMKLSSSNKNSVADTTGQQVENYGANVILGIAGLASWRGVVSEAEDTYPISANDKNFSTTAQNIYHVQNAYILPKRKDKDDLSYVNNIKRALVNYGAVYAAFNSYTENWSSDDKNYYNHEYAEDMNGAHAITIVGWDDNYNKKNFTNVFNAYPPQNGAFLCKNSYGENENDKGYFYISYYDQNLCLTDETMVFPGVGSKNNYDNIYQHDAYGPTVPIKQQNEIKSANVFTGKYVNEQLEAVSFYTFDMGTNYEIYVIPDYEDSSDLDDFSDSVAKGSFDYAGYHTIKFDSAVPITGDKFAVVVKLIKQGETVNSFIEMPISTGNSYMVGLYSVAKANLGESFIYQDGTWKDLTTLYSNANNCIKAFTKGTTAKLSLFEAEEPIAAEGIMTVDELVAQGVQLNPLFLNYIQNDAQLFASNTNQTAEKGGLEPSPAEFGRYDSQLYRDDKYPVKYSLKEMGLVSPVKNQLHDFATCWMHGIYGSLESCMLRLVARTRSDMLNGGVGGVDGDVNVTAVTLDHSSYTMATGNTLTLHAEVTPSTAINKNISWSSSNPAVASVDIYGTVTAHTAGNTTIVVTTEEGDKTASCSIQVTAPVAAQSIAFDPDANKVYKPGDMVFLPYSISPTNAAAQVVELASSNPEVASVNEYGMIFAKTKGTAIITAKLKDSSTIFAATVLSVSDGDDVFISNTSAVEQSTGKYLVSFNLNTVVEGMQVFVGSYNHKGQLMGTELVSASKDANSVIVEQEDVSHFKVFVWDGLEQNPLSDTVNIIPQ